MRPHLVEQSLVPEFRYGRPAGTDPAQCRQRLVVTRRNVSTTHTTERVENN